MPLDLTTYTNRVNIYGTTQRARDISLLKADISSNVVNSLSYKTVTINGVNGNLIINSDNTFSCLPNQTILVGDIVVYSGSTYMVLNRQIDDEVYISGQLARCNYLLKFIGSDGSIKTRNCVIENLQSVTPTAENQYIITGDQEFRIRVPYDSSTVLISRDDRFLIDYGTTSPLAYKVTGVDRVTENYGSDGGIIVLTVKEDGRSTDRDSVDNLIADYDKYIPTPPVPTSNYAEITYSGEAILFVNAALKTFTAGFYEPDGDEVEATPVWFVTVEDNSDLQYITQETSGSTIKISITDISMVGKTVRLTLQDNGETMSTYVDLLIKKLG
jgi:hypothetical protein